MRSGALNAVGERTDHPLAQLDWTPLEQAGMIAVFLFLLVIVCGPCLIATEEPAAEKAPLVSIPRGPLLLVLGLLGMVAMVAEEQPRTGARFMPKPAGSVPEPGGCGFTVFALTMTVGRFIGDRLVQHWGRNECCVILRSWHRALGFLIGLYSDTLEGAMIGSPVSGSGLRTLSRILLQQCEQDSLVNREPGLQESPPSVMSGFLIGPPPDWDPGGVDRFRPGVAADRGLHPDCGLCGTCQSNTRE